MTTDLQQVLLEGFSSWDLRTELERRENEENKMAADAAPRTYGFEAGTIKYRVEGEQILNGRWAGYTTTPRGTYEKTKQFCEELVDRVDFRKLRITATPGTGEWVEVCPSTDMSTAGWSL